MEVTKSNMIYYLDNRIKNIQQKIFELESRLQTYQEIKNDIETKNNELVLKIKEYDAMDKLIEEKRSAIILSITIGIC